MSLVVVLKWLLLAVLLLLVAAAAAAGWHFSERILRVVEPGFQPEFLVHEVAEDAVSLPRGERSLRPGLFGLRWEDGRGLVSGILAVDETRVRRRFEQLEGSPLTAGEPAQIDVYLYGGDPLAAHGYPFEAVVLSGEAGALHAWWLDGETDTAVVMLHGRGATRSEALRTLPAVKAGGYGVLVLAYRNHDGSTRSSDGFHHYGASEWRDVIHGLAFLETQGVRRVVLYGFSMGGAVALETARALQRAQGEPDGGLPGLELAGLVLDAPMLDVHAAIHAGALRTGAPLPGVLTPLALFVARLRTGIDWRSLDKRRTLHEVRVPILLIHGSADTVTPVWVSDAFAALAPEQIRYHRVEGAEHVEAWNQDPESYETWLRAFLSEVMGVARSVVR